MNNEETNENTDNSKTEKFVVAATCAGVVAFVLEPLVEKGVKFVKAYLKNR